MIDILGYSFDDFPSIFNLLHSSSIQMRHLLKRNYFVIKNMLNETHSLEGLVELIRNCKTSRPADQHDRLHRLY
jgi:hypothetical protein